MKLGVHVSIAGGFSAALGRAQQLECTAFQIFSRSPRGGPAPKLDPADLAQFQAGRREAGISPLVVHAPYIINIASPEAAMFSQSLRLFREEYQRCGALGADYLVTHVGSPKESGVAAGILRVAEAINKTLEDRKNPTMILLENTAGSGQGLGFAFEHLHGIREQIDERKRVGVCLDTAHTFAAGYAIHTADGLDDTIKQFDRAIGLPLLKVMHLNDSKAAFDSRVDRHEHIGKGCIGLEAMRRIVTHPALRDVPMILETPKDTDEDDPRNLATVRQLVLQRAGGFDG